jgi:hypothetical protein
MHITKNVFNNIIRTLLDIPRKAKEGLKSCNDLVQFGLRSELHPMLRNNEKHYLPPASYSLKHSVSACVGVRVPTNFSFNISKLVSMKNMFMSDYNSHDCHIMMMIFLVTAIRAIKPMRIKVLITRLCYFFNTIS